MCKKRFALSQVCNLFLVICLGGACLRAAEWPSWRGPAGDGHAVASNLPVKWDESSHVLWKTSLPGEGWSTPVVQGNAIWLTVARGKKGDAAYEARRKSLDTGGQPLDILASVNLRALCLNRESGVIEKDLDLLTVDSPQWVHKDNTYASPSPVLEGSQLYCHFGAFGTVCVNLSNDEIAWANTDLKVMHENGPGGSPLLYDGKLFIHCDGSDQQYVAALDAKNGMILWKRERSGEMHSNPQLKKCYGTPVIQFVQGRPQLISQGADWLYGYDPSTGVELWRLDYEHLGFSIVPKPIVDGDMIYLSTSFMRPHLLAVKNDGQSAPSIRWRVERSVPSVPSPILVNDRLYYVSDQGGLLSCIDIESGKEVYRERLGGNYYASPILADGMLLFCSREGKITFVEPGPEFRVLAENKLDGAIAASPVAIGSDLFIRTDRALYRIGHPEIGKQSDGSL